MKQLSLPVLFLCAFVLIRPTVFFTFPLDVGSDPPQQIKEAYELENSSIFNNRTGEPAAMSDSERISWNNIHFSIPNNLTTDDHFVVSHFDETAFDLFITSLERPFFLVGATAWQSAEPSLDREFANLLAEETMTVVDTSGVMIAGRQGRSATVRFERELGQFVLIQSAETYLLFFAQDETSVWWHSLAQTGLADILESLTIQETDAHAD